MHSCTLVFGRAISYSQILLQEIVLQTSKSVHRFFRCLDIQVYCASPLRSCVSQNFEAKEK